MFHDMLWGGMWFGSIFWIVILVLLVWIVVRNTNRNHDAGNSGRAETPLDILKKRYAKGDISKEQFEQMKRDIS